EDAPSERTNTRKTAVKAPSAADAKAAALLSKSWRHSPFLLERTRAHKGALNKLARNALREEEEAAARAGRPVDASAALEQLVVRGEDLFALPEVGQLAPKERQEKKQQRREQKQARK